MRQNTSLNPQRLQCDELLHMIILEAMSEMEKTDTHLDDPANQYQWMNITQTVTFSLLHGTASFSRLLKMLYESVSMEFISITCYKKVIQVLEQFTLSVYVFVFWPYFFIKHEVYSGCIVTEIDLIFFCHLKW